MQLATLNAMRMLGGPHLRPVRGRKLLVAHFVTLRRRSVLPKCDRVSMCTSLHQNAVTVHVITSECITVHVITSECVTVHVITSECRHGTRHYIRMRHGTRHYIRMRHGTRHYIRMPSRYTSLHQNAVTVHVITPECRHGTRHYNRIPSPTFIVAKITLARQLFVKNTYTTFHEKPIKGLVADTRYLTEVRTDGRTEVVCTNVLVGRNNSAVTDTNLNTSTLQSETQHKAASAFSTDERRLSHRRQNSANVSVTVNITSCVGIAHCRGI